MGLVEADEDVRDAGLMRQRPAIPLGGQAHRDPDRAPQPIPCERQVVVDAAVHVVDAADQDRRQDAGDGGARHQRVDDPSFAEDRFLAVVERRRDDRQGDARLLDARVAEPLREEPLQLLAFHQRVARHQGVDVAEHPRPVERSAECLQSADVLVERVVCADDRAHGRAGDLLYADPRFGEDLDDADVREAARPAAAERETDASLLPASHPARDVFRSFMSSARPVSRGERSRRRNNKKRGVLSRVAPLKKPSDRGFGPGMTNGGERAYSTRASPSSTCCRTAPRSTR